MNAVIDAGPPPPGPPPANLPALLCYLRLLRAVWEAEAAHRPAGHDPVPVADFRRFGITDWWLCWLLYEGHAQHHLPAARARRPGATRPVASVRLRADSRLALTKAGRQFAESWLAVLRATDGEVWWVGAPDPPDRLVPRYEPARRLFRWGGHVVKHFQQPSPNQEWLLRAAEELGWPPWFDDPLPRGRGNAKRRLHETIQDLNRHQRVPVVHFKGDGSGTRVGWELR